MSRYLSYSPEAEGGKYGLWSEMPDGVFLRDLSEVREIDDDLGIFDKANAGQISACEDGTFDCLLEPLWHTGVKVWEREE